MSLIVNGQRVWASSLLVLSLLFNSGLLDLMKSVSINKRQLLLIAVFQESIFYSC
jgi:hypothetical protein